MKRLLLFMCLVILVAAGFTGVYSYLHGDPEDPQRMEGRAMLGDTDAQFKLAKRLSHGDGVPEDDKAALKWYREAATKGHPKAALTLSRLYFTGDGVDQDDEQGAEWMQRAADGGDSYAQALLGMLYLGGIGVEPSPQMSLHWLNTSQEREAVLLSGSLAAELAAIDSLPAIIRKGRMKEFFDEKKNAINRIFRKAIEHMKDKEEQLEQEEQGEDENGH